MELGNCFRHWPQVSTTAPKPTSASFSQRHGFAVPQAEIVVREDAPSALRDIIVDIAYEAGLRPSDVRSIFCRALREPENSNNWSEFPNIDLEARSLIGAASWFQVYDLVEAIFRKLESGERPQTVADGSNPADHFACELNQYFAQKGIGWHLDDGRIQMRGSSVFQASLMTAKQVLETHQTAQTEIEQALLDLSRRPKPDITGAIQHAMAGLECVAREVSGNKQATLGEILKTKPDLLPPPLDKGIEKLWGYASEQGRHLREGRVPSFDEAELVVGVAAAVATYLVKKFGQGHEH